MSTQKKSVLFLFIATLISTPLVTAKDPNFLYKNEKTGVTATISGKSSVGTDFSRNNFLLNGLAAGAKGSKYDQSIALKSKFLLTTNIKANSGVEMQATVCAKSTWGNPKALTTTKTSIKVDEVLIGEHSHNLEPRVLFLREGWMKLNLDAIFGSDLWEHSFTAGMFSFDVGRGIALGDAYAVNPSSLGFWQDSSVDQLAPGFKLSGNLYTKMLAYDMYVAILTNKSTGLKDSGEQLYDQLILKNAYAPNFARGFGHVDIISAARLRWTPIEDKEEEIKVYFEPYAVGNRNPAQFIEYAADASGKLGTFGLSAEFQYGAVEFGCEGAFNRGHQEVSAWDRNKVILKRDSTTGALTQVYSHVYNEIGLTTNTVYLGDAANVYRPTVALSSALNSAAIDGTTKFNGAARFRDAYRNEYKGWMVVSDASLFIYKRDLKVSVTAGYTSGDVNPNTSKTGDVREYKGFIPLQEMYAGKRVKSYFVMGPVSALNRPNPLEEETLFSSAGLEGFTNMIFTGIGLTFAPKEWSKKFSLNPNMLLFWQDVASKKFGSIEDASNRLGVEFNLFSSFDLVENLKLTGGCAVFLPGKHYVDLKGTALSRSIANVFAKEEDSGVAELLPTLSTDTAFSLSIGMEYSF